MKKSVDCFNLQVFQFSSLSSSSELPLKSCSSSLLADILFMPAGVGVGINHVKLQDLKKQKTWLHAKVDFKIPSGFPDQTSTCSWHYFLKRELI